MKHAKRIAALCLAAALFLTGCASGASGSAAFSPENPVTVTVWHYYNGPQQQAFADLVNEFNETVGREKGIAVQQSSQATVTDLETSVLAAANREVGAPEVPNIFAAYADTAYAVDRLGLVADLRPYLTDEELAEYVPGYLEEGAFSGEGTLKIFPIAKSVELLMLNATDWEKFAAATGADDSAFATVEGITETARQYYEWTDAQTPDISDDGKAFFGRDAFANYMIIGARQLGVELLRVEDGAPVLDFDKDVVRRLWDNYYVPFINGWFGASGRFRSDDIKMGNIIACVGSSSGAAYFPDECILSDTESYPIEMRAYPCPKFEGGEDFAVQQGAGLVVTNAAPQEVEASVEFLKWFTEAGRNLEFSLGSGYVPVKKEANEMTFVEQAMDAAGASSKMRAIITNAIDMTGENQMYTTKAFRNGTAARAILNDSMVEKARADREAFLALTAEGMPHEEAAAQFVTDENFEARYEETRTALEMCIAG